MLTEEDGEWRRCYEDIIILFPQYDCIEYTRNTLRYINYMQHINEYL